MVLLRNTILFLFLFLSVHCEAQDSLLVSYLLQRVASQQNVTDRTITTGNFPSYISNQPSFRKTKKDDNVFFAALINYTLRRYSHSLSSDNQGKVDSIQQNTYSLYKHFQNRKGRLTYNFWRTDTAFAFPYTSWIRHIKNNTSLPDDMDDTVLSLLAQDTDSAMAAGVHDLMQSYVSRNKKAKTIEKKYRGYKAYTVWYGKKFPPVFDVCVLSNVLSFVQKYNLRWTAADSASLQVIVQSVTSHDFIAKPIYVSPYYGSTSLILYHLARLMSYKNIPQLEALKIKLIIAAAEQCKNTDDMLEKVILSIAILKWGYVPPEIYLLNSKKAIQQIEESNLPFFTGNITSYFSPFYKRLFTQKRWLLFYHYCPAFNDALLLEYLLIKQQPAVQSIQ